MVAHENDAAKPNGDEQQQRQQRLQVRDILDQGTNTISSPELVDVVEHEGEHCAWEDSTARLTAVL